MSTGFDVFDQTVQKSFIWLNDLMVDQEWEDRHRAYLALRAVLHTLRDRLTVDNAAHLAAQLPTLIRGIYYEGWVPLDKPTRYRHKDEFLALIGSYFPTLGNIDVEGLTRGVFRVLSKHVGEGELKDVKQVLPEEIRELWP